MIRTRLHAWLLRHAMRHPLIYGWPFVVSMFAYWAWLYALSVVTDWKRTFRVLKGS